ncbi:NAD(P)-binding protein [Backusella circina FSU 941]|nr:NAD(P)-binding protein [Backusella circina FSU 941]
MSQIYVITGASRGIGLEYVKQLSSQEGNVVYAGARNPEGSEGLMALVDNKKVFAFAIDVNSRESIEKAAAKVAETATEGIDVLINNAGISNSIAAQNSLNILNTPREEYTKVLDTNVGGVSDTTQAFLPLLRQRGNDKVKRIINMSSILGSVGFATNFGKTGETATHLEKAGTNSAYKVSKTALNMITALFANALEVESFVVISIHPGWVRTDMGGQNAHLEVPDSVRHLISSITSLTTADNGRFLNYDGQSISW